MLFRLIGLIFFIIVVFSLFGFLKLIFQLGRAANEFQQKKDDMFRSGKQGRTGGDKNGNVIELDKNQYKVE